MQLQDSIISLYSIDHNYENYYNCLKQKYLLSIEEQFQADQFKFEKDRISYLVSHISLRLLLGIHTKISPSAIIYNTNKFGKPHIENASIHFNLSHSGTKSIIGFYQKEIGVDIEHISKKLDIDKVKSHILIKNEQNLLNQFYAENARLKFLELWTRKEALLKAIGTGIHENINMIDVSDLDYFNNLTSSLDTQKWKIQSVEINDGLCPIDCVNSHKL